MSYKKDDVVSVITNAGEYVGNSKPSVTLYDRKSQNVD